MDTPFKPCSVENCNGNASSKARGAAGLCCAHYKKKLKYGDPLHVFKRGDSKTVAWLKAHVETTSTDCLIWPFATNKAGYGLMSSIFASSRLAHRIMCEMKHGNPPSPSMDAAHSCGNGNQGCVNPLHLRWDTRSGNFSDKLIHGTDNRGEKNPLSKLTQSDVLIIKSLRGKVPQRKIAAMFGVDQSNVCKIQREVSWSY